MKTVKFTTEQSTQIS